LNVPVGRGYGYTQVGAPEQSARLTVAGERENYRHTATQEAFRTTLAYLNVIAARDNLTEYEASAERNRRIIQLSDQAVQIGDIAAVETNRSRARSTRVESSISSARAALIQARISLAEAMGLDPDRLDVVPVPTESFASSSVTLPNVDALVSQALDR